MSSVFLNVLILLLIPTVISTILTWWKTGKKFSYVKDLRYLFFYSIVYFVLFSAGKIIVGYSKRTLLDAFSGIGKMTFVHYLPILLVLSIIFPMLILKLIIRDKIYAYLSNFISFFLMLIVIKLFISHYIYNLDVCIFAILSIVVAFVRKERQNIVASKEAFIQRLKISIPVALFAATTVFVYFPATLYIMNMEEFQISPAYYLGILCLYSTVIVVLYCSLFSYFMVTEDFIIGNAAIGVFTFCGYIQANFLNGKMMSLDGNMQEWEQSVQISNIIVWIIITIILLAVLIIQKRKATKLYIYVMCSLVIMQVVSLTGLIVSYDWSKNSVQHYMSANHTLDLDDKNNVIVFVLDWFDEKLVENLYSDEPEAFEEFNNFTWYQNTTSRYAFTGLSIPYLLTGVDKPSDKNDDEYVDYAYEHSEYGDLIASLKYDVVVCTSNKYVREPFAEKIINYQERGKGKYNSDKLFLTMLDCVNYSILPFVLKDNYYYTATDLKTINRLEDELNNGSDYEFGKKLFDEGIRIVDKDNLGINGAFRFYHLWGAHSFYNIDRNANQISDNGSRTEQALGCLKIVSEFVRQMKEANLYENATIIITADHGQNIYLDDPEGAEKENLLTTSSPVFMIKKSGANISENIKVSTVPISHTELMPTVFEAMGLERGRLGKTIDEIVEDEERTRLFIFGRTPDIPYVTYEIKGDARDKNNWTMKEK